MSINQDFSDLFAELNTAGARYLLVGGYAIAVHAEPRFHKGPGHLDRSGDHIVPVIGLTHLIDNKRASGRPQDRADVDLLTKHRDN